MSDAVENAPYSSREVQKRQAAGGFGAVCCGIIAYVVHVVIFAVFGYASFCYMHHKYELWPLILGCVTFLIACILAFPLILCLFRSKPVNGLLYAFEAFDVLSTILIIIGFVLHLIGMFAADSDYDAYIKEGIEGNGKFGSATKIFLDVCNLESDRHGCAKDYWNMTIFSSVMYLIMLVESGIFGAILGALHKQVSNKQ